MDSCETKTDNPHNLCIQKSFNARCTESNAATNASDGVNYAVGTMVWTLFDYVSPRGSNAASVRWLRPSTDRALVACAA